MPDNTHYSQKVPVFHGRTLPERAWIVGYAAVIEGLKLPMPMVDRVALISEKHRVYETESWSVRTPRHRPEETLYHQLIFALKYEGINLLFFKKLFEKLSKQEVLDLLSYETTGQYTRKLWFLYEWLMQKELPLPDMTIKNYVLLAEPGLQYVLPDGPKSARHRIINNLPGTVNFCPMIRRTERLEAFVGQDLQTRKNEYLKGIRKSILQRASAFLILKDSKASFSIEGESPKSKRTMRWSQAIGQAGLKDLSREEFERLQQIVIESNRFVKFGYRKHGGFIGEHDPETHSPIPAHISAKAEDITPLMDGLIETNKLLLISEINPVIAAAVISFGFVFIHPFVDGNGRIHRYLIHHILARTQFSQQGFIFPVSAAILDRIADYTKTLESYSTPLLDFIDWVETPDHNVEVRNNTIDYYRYFDATTQAEFLFECVEDTIDRIIPQEVKYLQKYDEFKDYIDNTFEMSNSQVGLLLRFLEQNNGKLSKRVLNKEFAALEEKEVREIETTYRSVFLG